MPPPDPRLGGSSHASSGSGVSLAAGWDCTATASLLSRRAGLVQPIPPEPGALIGMCHETCWHFLSTTH